MRVPSRLKTTRLIRWPRTRALKPEAQDACGVRRRRAVPVVVVSPIPLPGRPWGPAGAERRRWVRSRSPAPTLWASRWDVDPAAQPGRLITLLIRLIWPLRASSRPMHGGSVVQRDARQGHQVALEGRGGAERRGAADLPEHVARRGAVDQCTELADAVVSLDVISKTNCAFGSPCGVEGERARQLGRRREAVAPRRLQRPVAEVVPVRSFAGETGCPAATS